MTIEQAYITFLQEVNRNSTEDNIDVDKSRFVLMFNKIQGKFVEWVLEKRNEDELRDIQNLLVLDKPLANGIENENHKDFPLPDNYFDHSSLQVFGSKASCKDKKIFSFEVKNDNVDEYLADCFNEPSFEYRETFYTLSSNTVSIYFSKFDITIAKLSYYRYPVQVDIDGYINLDNNQSTNIDPEFSDRTVNRIITAMSKDFSAVNEEYNKYQADKDRLFSKI